jgi:uncharacterized protein (TIGR03437 family)
MRRTFSSLALALLVCAAVPAAVINTTLTVNATGTPSATFTSFAIAGTVSFTGGLGTGKIASTVPLDLSTASVVADYTITLDAGGTLSGKLTVPLSILNGGVATVNLTITGGTGTYSGATSGTSPIALTGTVSGDIVSGFKLTNFTSGTFTITTGGTPPPPVPTITAVQDAASNTPNIAQGSIFIVKGSNLSASGYTPFGPPRPTVSSGVKVTFTPVSGGGAGTDAYLVYLYNQSGVNQIACILPSTVAVGSYNVTVTNGTVSAPVVAQVVANKIGLFTQDSTGSGLASVQNYISQTVVDLNRLTTGVVSGVTISPAHPGQAVIAYGTGLGAYAAGDNTASPAFDFRSTETIVAVVGGVNIPVAYAGRAGYAGEDQINFTLPTNIQTGCAVTLQISVNGKLSAPTSIAIAPDANSTACVMPGYTTQQLTNFDNGGTYTTGYFSLTQFAMSIPSLGTEKVNSIAGAFSKITGFQLASASQGDVSVIQSGSCQVIQSTISGTTSVSGTVTHLDAGTVTINGPAGSSLTNLALTKTDNSYSLTNIEGFSLPGQTSFSLPPGTYTLNGAGGNDVGTFNTSITLGSPLTLSSPLPDTVVRSAGLTVNWSGGNASDLVEIIGGTSTTTGTGSSAVTNSTSFLCLTTAGQRTFTVPASILTQLQPATTGSLIVASGVTPATFTASLKAGGSIDSGSFTSFVGIGGSPAYQ